MHPRWLFGISAINSSALFGFFSYFMTPGEFQWPLTNSLLWWPLFQGVKVPGTWRTIPLSKWLITMVSKSPKWCYSPYTLPKWLINGGYQLLTNWHDPPSMFLTSSKLTASVGPGLVFFKGCWEATKTRQLRKVWKSRWKKVISFYYSLVKNLG